MTAQQRMQVDNKKTSLGVHLLQLLADMAGNQTQDLIIMTRIAVSIKCPIQPTKGTAREWMRFWDMERNVSNHRQDWKLWNYKSSWGPFCQLRYNQLPSLCNRSSIFWNKKLSVFVIGTVTSLPPDPEWDSRFLNIPDRQVQNLTQEETASIKKEL